MAGTALSTGRKRLVRPEESPAKPLSDEHERSAASSARSRPNSAITVGLSSAHASALSRHGRSPTTDRTSSRSSGRCRSRGRRPCPTVRGERRVVPVRREPACATDDHLSDAEPVVTLKEEGRDGLGDHRGEPLHLAHLDALLRVARALHAPLGLAEHLDHDVLSAGGALRYGTSALSTYDFDRRRNESVEHRLVEALAHVERPQAQLEHEAVLASSASDWRSSAYDAPPGPETLPSAANDGVARPSACIRSAPSSRPPPRRAERASKKERCTPSRCHTQVVPRHICAEPEASAAARWSRAEERGRSNIAITEA